ncbi:tRNA-guanine transglycosylase DpdA [Cyanobium sp. N5-Cardenillas]|uniref:tRNA-guanine transglycosylase DpdA n=1 Tax=Cyanobium sp. N5-Cardenillas TaxID=2823720 RepID=UPI0020CC638B|nr:tRNA-guanine transglycosylase DpdA [Cyanobium sp. N5-Cardenillas]MCP9784953.1 hypothetical protein [Cyanobium sp. N5-Cardenillas]
MKFFFPDSSDFVDPSFDFLTEERSRSRVRQRDDKYAHELLDKPPYDGVLVSKAAVDGSVSGSGKYTVAQKLRFYREGVRKFMRLDDSSSQHLLAMGDCGAFAYVNEPEPPYRTEEVLDFYESGQFDFGVSPDHVILGFDLNAENSLPGIDAINPDWIYRQQITIERAAEFLACHNSRRCKFEPIGAIQGWSPTSYAKSLNALQKMGYRYIAVGGVVPLKTKEILAVLQGMQNVLLKETKLHLLGVTRPEFLEEFKKLGVVSFDSTAPLQRAFKDSRVNYFADPEPFTAIRVPQVEGNPRLQRNIKAGKIDQGKAFDLEGKCLSALRRFDAGSESVESVIAVLLDYAELHDPVDRSSAYRKTLEARPWKNCECAVCRNLGIDVVLFRGAERNRRRGFHNLHAFRRCITSPHSPHSF